MALKAIIDPNISATYNSHSPTLMVEIIYPIIKKKMYYNFYCA